MSREEHALGAPPADLTGFPHWLLRRTRSVWRAHRKDRSPWWFASDLTGRFDLAPPHGTCYLASGYVAAARERWGERLSQRGYVMRAMADETVVSTLSVPRSHRLADVTNSDAARYGVTREINTAVPYTVPQQWAAAFADAGLAGVRYEARFSTGPQDQSFALFGPAGAADWPADPSPRSGADVAAKAGVQVLDVPHSVATIVPPS